MTLTKRVIEHHTHYSKDIHAEGAKQTQVLDGVAMSSLTGVLYQLGWLANYSHELFEDLFKTAQDSYDRITAVSSRVQRLHDSIPMAENVFLSNKDPAAFYGNTGIEWKSDHTEKQQHLGKDSTPIPVAGTYQECKPMPNLRILNQFFDPPKECSKDYSNPSYFIDAWVEAETQQHRKVAEERKAKRARRKEKGARKTRTDPKQKEVAQLQTKTFNPMGAEFADSKAQEEALARREEQRANIKAGKEREAQEKAAQQQQHQPPPQQPAAPPPAPAPQAPAAAGGPPAPPAPQPTQAGAPPPPPGPPGPPGGAAPPPPPPGPGGAAAAPPPPPPPGPGGAAPPPPPPPAGGAPPPPPPPPTEPAIIAHVPDTGEDFPDAPAPPAPPAPPPPPAQGGGPPPPPPPPGAGPPKAPPAPPPQAQGGATIAAVAKAPPAAPIGRGALLSQIAAGKQLRRVDRSKPKPPPKEEAKIGGVFDVSAILKKSLDMRRNAAEGSDTESDSDSDDDWD